MLYKCSNRTFMELERDVTKAVTGSSTCSNRTFMELKLRTGTRV